ncbi:hypothetical protein Kpol_1064p28 [Vanderwaltozyma polyspora DSM 70294]|uniref:Tubulin-specific chaperone A n=1 Tax=Vanderwaltozyma polyspora (strain ATCC 22028 / DSM 70294 / BCRC 21397 / CBS 2163 / NBRC 10782 / NRRL Y-8283 / UCD 57-17) TaxID=436907 RepID=A7TMF3_VANPO|nr:uncharacterized protein Kpol_1064p28 [Vanderwaltozyma polyspora DSM 70294]EDO16547.1 hypothetical protein Kpol_1064p28 [Vanderwaltozyma polyspora DSM 70294]
MAPTQLEIKVKALQRLVKEEGFYQQELKDQTDYVEKLRKDSSVDPYDLKKQIEVQQDTERLLPTLYKKIGEFKENLEEYLKTYQGNESLDDANKIIEEADNLIASQ